MPYYEMIIFLPYLLNILTFPFLMRIDNVNIALNYVQIDERNVATVINDLDVLMSMDLMILLCVYSNYYL